MERGEKGERELDKEKGKGKESGEREREGKKRGKGGRSIRKKKGRRDGKLM
jgi:hypothetical protein